MTTATTGPTEVRSGLYLSQSLGRPLLDVSGERIAQVRDLLARFGSEPHPPVSGVVASQAGREFFVDARPVEEISVCSTC